MGMERERERSVVGQDRGQGYGQGQGQVQALTRNIVPTLQSQDRSLPNQDPKPLH